jgi:hypothetical protein
MTPRLALCLALRAEARALWGAMGVEPDIERCIPMAVRYVELELARYDLLMEYRQERYRRKLKGNMSWSYSRW